MRSAFHSSVLTTSLAVCGALAFGLGAARQLHNSVNEYRAAGKIYARGGGDFHYLLEQGVQGVETAERARQSARTGLALVR